jgi:hypothetical protein
VIGVVRISLWIGLLMLTSIDRVAAQGGSPSTSEPTTPLHLGPIGLAPSIAVTNAGLDTNVFNEPDAKQDMTMTLTPRTTAGWRIGRARFVGDGAIDFVHFSHFASERSIDTHDHVSVEAPLNRLRVRGFFRYLNTRQRTDDDLDKRTRKVEREAGANVERRIASKTRVALTLQQLTASFDDAAEASGSMLQQVLNRRVRTVTTSVRYAASPMTSLSIIAEDARARFEHSPPRNADSFRFGPGFEFSPHGPLRGRAFVGYQRFDIADPYIRDFTGAVAASNLEYVLFDATRINVGINRDVAFSFRIDAPYYVRSALTTSVTHRFGESWVIGGNVARRWLDYRTTTLAPVNANRDGNTPRERVGAFGVTVDRYLTRTTTFSFQVSYQQRRSDLTTHRDYERFRFGTAIRYAFD